MLSGSILLGLARTNTRDFVTVTRSVNGGISRFFDCYTVVCKRFVHVTLLKSARVAISDILRNGKISKRTGRTGIDPAVASA